MGNQANADLAEITDPVALTAALIDIPSESFSEVTIADAAESFLRALDHLQVERVGNTLIARTNLGRDQRVVIAGHLDTVPANDNLPHRVETDRIYGLGATDMKGGVAVALRLAAEVVDPSVDVTYLFYDCEEVASEHNGLAKLAAVNPVALKCDFAILMEPSNALIEAGCQGTLRAEITATGERAHSARAWMGDNAIHNATEILQRLASYQQQTVSIDGLDYREGLNAVLIRGGIAGNVIPDECVVTVNYRYSPASSPDEAETHVREVFEGFGVEVVDNAGGALPGLTSPLATKLLAQIGETPIHPKLGWTDVSRFAALGIPAVNFGPGDPTIAHTQGEFVETNQITACHQVLKAFLS